MAELQDYLNLITHQHQKPKFQATVAASAKPLIDIINFLKELNQKFDIETAKNDQLRIIAEWVGAPNAIPNAIPIQFFGWRGQVGALTWSDQDGDVGQEVGFWRDSGMSGYRAMPMSNELFKRVIKAKILLNNTDCSIDSAKEIIELVINKPFVIHDKQDMTVDFEFLGDAEEWERQLVVMMFPKPAGVQLTFGGKDEY
jgi:hypothetical protein